jgi:glycosyltransferase involved in cell wall biosynthesis
MRVLWLSPNFNHYKARFLNLLVEQHDIELDVLAGAGFKGQGHDEIKEDWKFRLNRVEVPKSKFGYSWQVIRQVMIAFGEYDWIMIPREKKNILLIFSANFYRKFIGKKSAKLVSYNHPFFDNILTGIFSTQLLRLFYLIYDRIIFYNERSAELAVKHGVIKKEKAFWANNTLDENEVNKYYNFETPDINNPRLLFIGRLIPSKEVGLLVTYFKAIQEKIPNLGLDVVGDGPEMNRLKKLTENVSGITLHGSKNKESELAPLFSKSCLVFVPGHSGLSVNHAFLYGRAYVTLQRDNHAPEVHYIMDGENGFVLNGDKSTNIKIIAEILQDKKELDRLSLNARKSGSNLSIEDWCEQIMYSLNSNNPPRWSPNL